MRRLARLSLYIMLAFLALLIAAFLAGLAVIKVSSDDRLEHIVIDREISGLGRQPPSFVGERWALEIFLVDRDQGPDVVAVANGRMRFCQTDYYTRPEIHFTAIHIPREGPCRVRNWRF